MTMHTAQVTPSLAWIKQQQARPLREKSVQEQETDLLLEKLEKARKAYGEAVEKGLGPDCSAAWAAQEQARKDWKQSLKKLNLPKPRNAHKRVPRQGDPLLDAIFGAGGY